MEKAAIIVASVAVIVIGIAAVLLTPKTPPPDSGAPVNLTPTEILGQVRSPAGVAPESLTVVGLGATAEVGTDGAFTARVREDGISVLGAMPQGKEFGLIKVVIATPNKPKELPVLDVNSTAVAAVFLTPYFITNDPTQAQKIIQIIRQDPKVGDLAQIIEQIFSKPDPLSEPAYQEALGAAIESVLTSLSS